MDAPEIERRIAIHQKHFAALSDATYSDDQPIFSDDQPLKTQMAANHAIVLAELRHQLAAERKRNSPLAYWTDDRIDTLKQLWKEGQSAKFIAETLGGVSLNAVIGKAHRLGLKRQWEEPK